jgi:hypothetical protein
MKRLVFLLIIFTLFNTVYVLAQHQRNAYFIGLNPSITVEPFYEKGELDINVFPLVYQQTITNRIDFRVSTILNYGIRKSRDEISHFGGRIAFPVFLKKKDDLSIPSKGIYFAPGIGLTRNRIENHTNFGFWLEPGYNLMITQKWTISFGIQLGATHFDYDNGTKKWDNHFGMTIILGFWL